MNNNRTSHINHQSGWSDKPIEVISAAIYLFSLRELGWRGFEALAWVKEIKRTYPAIAELASSATTNQGDFITPARELFENACPLDRPGIQSYFIGKLALEHLSCQFSGVAALNCDKRAAFMQIWELSKRYVPALA